MTDWRLAQTNPAKATICWCPLKLRAEVEVPKTWEMEKHLPQVPNEEVLYPQFNTWKAILKGNWGPEGLNKTYVDHIFINPSLLMGGCSPPKVV